MFKKEQVFKTRLDIHRHRLSRAKLPTAVGGAVGTGAFRSVLLAFEREKAAAWPVLLHEKLHPKKSSELTSASLSQSVRPRLNFFPKPKGVQSGHETNLLAPEETISSFGTSVPSSKLKHLKTP